MQVREKERERERERKRACIHKMTAINSLIFEEMKEGRNFKNKFICFLKRLFYTKKQRKKVVNKVKTMKKIKISEENK
jgi:hypothetical protein